VALTSQRFVIAIEAMGSNLSMGEMNPRRRGKAQPLSYEIKTRRSGGGQAEDSDEDGRGGISNDLPMAVVVAGRKDGRCG